VSLAEAPARQPTTRRKTDPADYITRRAAYELVIRKEWGEPGQSAFNLRRELANLRSRPDLMTEAEHRLVHHLEKHAIKGAEVHLSPLHERRLASITYRFVNPSAEWAWRRRQAEEKASLDSPSDASEALVTA
jgi:hypothetical protein